MSLHRFGRVLISLGVVLTATACSEQGVLPTSPVAPSSQAGTAAKPPASIKVTSTVADGFHIESDGLGPYVPSKSLTSEVQPIGDWVLDTLSVAVSRSNRKISLDFSSPIPGSAPGGGDPVALPNGSYKFRAMAQCSRSYINGDPGHPLQSFTQGQVELCPLRFAFEVGTERYVLLMNKSFANINGNFPTTDDATVTCTATISGACSAWLLTPSSPSGANATKLMRTDGNGTLLEDLGDFSMSFSIQFAKQ